MKTIAVIGLGHVGLSFAMYYASKGHKVIGVDKDQNKINLIRDGKCYLFEPQLEELFLQYNATHFFATHSTDIDYHKVDTALICVGSPFQDGSVCLKAIKEVADQLEKFPHLEIMVKTTLPPGSTRDLFKNHNKVYFVPEFLREGSAFSDIREQDLVVGVANKHQQVQIPTILSSMNKKIRITDFETAELLKYSSNAYHAMKIAFTNEISSIAQEYRVDAYELFDLFKSDHNLNISSHYLTPGPAYGGSCLSKDLSALTTLEKGPSQLTLLRSIEKSNTNQIKRIERLIYQNKMESLCFIGISFKPETNDLRDSLVVKLMKSKQAMDKVERLYFYDPLNSREHISNIQSLSLYSEIIELVETIVLGPHRLEDRYVLELVKEQKKVIDLGYFDYPQELKDSPNYQSVF